MKPSIPILAILSIVFIVTPVIASSVYKWVDENGNVHFGDNPNGHSAQRVKINKAPPPDPASVVNDEPDSPATTANTHSTAKKKAEDCKKMQERLATLETGEPLYSENDKGERHYLKEDEAAKEADFTRQLVNRLCG